MLNPTPKPQNPTSSFKFLKVESMILKFRVTATFGASLTAKCRASSRNGGGLGLCRTFISCLLSSTITTIFLVKEINGCVEAVNEASFFEASRLHTLTLADILLGLLLIEGFFGTDEGSLTGPIQQVSVGTQLDE